MADRTDIIICNAGEEGCDIETVFDTFSFLKVEDLDFKSNGDTIDLFGVGSKDTEIQIDGCTSNTSLDPSVNAARKLEIIDSIFTLGKNLEYDHIKHLDIKNTTIIADDREGIETEVININNSDVYDIGVGINLELDRDGTDDITGVSFNKSFVKKMDINFNTSYYTNNIQVYAYDNTTFDDIINKIYDFFGDTGVITAGKSVTTSLDRIVFANDTIIKGFAYAGDRSAKASGSNSIFGLLCGGWGPNGATEYNYIDSMLFSNFAYTTNWGYLWDGNSYFAGASDAITFLSNTSGSGGYTIQYNLFASGGTGSYWADLFFVVAQNLTSVNNHTYAIWMGGDITGGAVFNDTIQYNEFKSTSTGQYWGDLISGYQARAAGTSNRIMGLSTGDAAGSEIIHKYMFDTQANSINFGSLSEGRMYENGAVSNVNKALFGCGLVYTNQLWEVDFAAEFSLSLWGTATAFQGGNPTGSSGD